MAKRKGGVSKSDAIREMLAQNPKAKTSEIVSALGGKGIKVSDNLVYIIKSKGKAKKRRMKREKAVAASRNSGHSNPVELIVDVRRLAGKAGGIRHLKQLVDILAE